MRLKEKQKKKIKKGVYRLYDLNSNDAIEHAFLNFKLVQSMDNLKEVGSYRLN